VSGIFQVKPDDALAAGVSVGIHPRQGGFAALACPQHCHHRMDFKLKLNLFQISRTINHLHVSLKIRTKASNFLYMPGSKMSIKIIRSRPARILAKVMIITIIPYKGIIQYNIGFHHTPPYTHGNAPDLFFCKAH
jgi:hypothetical protein